MRIYIYTALSNAHTHIYIYHSLHISQTNSMPIPAMDPELIGAFATEFAQYPNLKQNGFSFLVDISGKLFPLKDVEGNIEAWGLKSCDPYMLQHAAVQTDLYMHVKPHPIDKLEVPGLCKAVGSVMRVTRGVGRFSAHLLAASLVNFFEVQKIFPQGITRDMDCIAAWSLRMGKALQRLVP